MKADHATWETELVIPETAKPIDVQMLEAFLRVEALLEKLLGRPEFIPASPAVIEMIEKGLGDAHTSDELQAASKKGKRTTNGK
jgi:hypothetical protein